ncbi:ATP-binding cassette domain-containing protein [Actinobacteria bacterium YIM 96077]|uniref:Multidrug ABC transporter ATP-binding protein n=1 Tax=Phytoactinopolyspora halophila TaxID=1981511 RepID=A0A329QCY3_9ACTN|nr:ATP-binding cassette domain-containing protein [Phytoactinopolyspora halophila]AYY14138.1 ATP-binding cassette domain-containing protein [Actinobacteria bacterium YIM 96077]RAW09599.1 multidrug ABC transporter ATP-binding protein [Phytoactinopolyspora halophila]
MSTTASYTADGAAPPAVEADELTHNFGATRALDGTTFAVERGEIFGLLGPNGAGKTTAIRILLTLLEPNGGKARVAGLDVTRHPIGVRRRVGWVPQDRTVDPLMTARENLTFAAGLYHLGTAAGRDRAAELLRLVDLDDDADRLARALSGGMRRRLELAMGLVHVPDVLFLDEPTLGLDITSRRRLWTYVREIQRTGTTILLTTHYLDEADALCDRVAIIHQGRIQAVDTPAELKRAFGRATVHARLPEPAPELAKRLGRHPHVHHIRVAGDVIELDTDATVPATGALVDECRAAGAAPLDLWTQRASLDDVFLTLTGQELHTDVESDSPEMT